MWVALAAAVVLWGREEPVDEPASHVFLTVEIGGSRYLVDGGYGRQHLLAQVDASLARVLHTEDLSSLPPATVITAQYDPLKDEGDAYAKRLSEAGIATDHQVADGMIHGFFGMTPAVPDAMKWVNHAGANLRKALA